jgi:hypothetical protein
VAEKVLMDEKILRVATVLGVPGFALGVMYLLLRSFDFDFSTINPIMSGAIAMTFLFGSVLNVEIHC